MSHPPENFLSLDLKTFRRHPDCLKNLRPNFFHFGGSGGRTPPKTFQIDNLQASSALPMETFGKKNFQTGVPWGRPHQNLYQGVDLKFYTHSSHCLKKF